jgi:hypothetical protein
MADKAVQQIATKRVAISKANAQMVAVVAAASFVTVFCLVASHAVLSQNQYQARVTKAKETAHKQLQANIKSFDDLAAAYKRFNSSDPNVIGGAKDGSGDNDGPNSKIVLDALPSKYDFPALASSLEKILADRQVKVGNITGTDDQLNQQGNTSSPTPTPVDMPFTFTVENANYASVNQLIDALQKSIRPIQIDSIDLSGGNNDLTVTVNAHTSFQPAKSLTITKKVVK